MEIILKVDVADELMAVIQPIISQAVMDAMIVANDTALREPVKPIMSKNAMKTWLGIGNDKMNALIDAGLPQTVVNNEVTYMPSEVMRFLKENTY